jgi:enamine deaminase RidA (YjgF/YER057c/UK114 family)
MTIPPLNAIDERLQAAGLAWPVPPRPVAAYVPAVRSGPWLVVSGQLPMAEGKLLASGRVPDAVSLEAAQAAARQCALNALAVVRAELGGDWARFVRVVRVGVFVACADGFTEQAKVANGASELLVALLGEAGQHARAAVGVSALPLGAAVEVELTVEVR